MVGMILVDNMGNFDYVIWPLDETIWNGLTTADCVFPCFLFIMGLAVPLALKREDRFKKETWYKILKRFALLFIIGMALNFQGRIPRVFTTWPFVGWRIMGVLQRISICYLVMSAMYLFFGQLYQYIIVISSCLGLYLALMYGVNVPPFEGEPCGRGNTSPECNTGAFFDQSIFGRKYMMWPYDPEGILSTLPSIFNTFIGLCYSLLMRKNS